MDKVSRTSLIAARFVITTFFCFAPGAALAADAAYEVTELWTGALFTSTYRVGLCFSTQGAVRGVVLLRLSSGKMDVYHIVGTVHDNDIEAAHSSGHSFKGRLVAPDKAEGIITLKNVTKIELEGRRERNVALVPEDCAPVPE